ncbi:MAG: zinc ribbon domain-containing protein, partial [Dehalococcoidales bacterium]|nr:zinc ribbon domain-containing protein [Dehalococcoidales bacterium]
LTGFTRCPKCGSPIIGTTLNGKYRYYRCRGAVPTTTRGKICATGYIKADKLEDSISFQIREILSSPSTLLQTLINENRQPDQYIQQLTKQIEQLRKKLAAYPAKEKNLYDLLQHDAVTKDYVLEAVNNLKQERRNDELQLESLLSSRKEATRADRLTIKLTQASGGQYRQLTHDYHPQNLLHPMSQPSKEDQITKKRNLYASINLKVLATSEGYEFNFTLDGTIISSKDTQDLSSFEDQLEQFEQQHPDISVGELLNSTKPLQGDTPFVQKVNQLKRNLVTIEQTWA